MKRKSLLLFLIAVILIIVSENFFLQEAYGHNHLGILIASAIGLATGILILIQIIRKYKA